MFRHLMEIKDEDQYEAWGLLGMKGMDALLYAQKLKARKFDELDGQARRLLIRAGAGEYLRRVTVGQ
jgi:hypothetical protein